jgi:uncharacterized membrane protein YgcG
MHPSRACRFTIGVLAAVLISLSLAQAQISTATRQRRVTDNTGVLLGAAVTAREVQSGFCYLPPRVPA